MGRHNYEAYCHKWSTRKRTLIPKHNGNHPTGESRFLNLGYFYAICGYNPKNNYSDRKKKSVLSSLQAVYIIIIIANI